MHAFKHGRLSALDAGQSISLTLLFWIFELDIQWGAIYCFLEIPFG